MFLAIVVYKVKFSESLALRSLLKSCYGGDVLVYVNGGCTFDLELPQNFHLIVNKTNQYLAKNYIDACNRCLISGHKAIGFFDQDTEIDINYLLHASSIVSEKIPVVYPILLDQNGTIVSPLRLGIFDYNKSEIIEGIHNDISFIGINSGSVFDPKIMLRLIDSSFQLDFLDHVICHKIYTSGMSFHVCKSKMKHCLSVREEMKLSPSRQLSVISSEKAYYLKYRRFGRLFWFFIFVGRVLKSITVKGYPYSLKELLKFLFH